jgi:hypothetical protein
VTGVVNVIMHVKRVWVCGGGVCVGVHVPGSVCGNGGQVSMRVCVRVHVWVCHSGCGCWGACRVVRIGGGTRREEL